MSRWCGGYDLKGQVRRRGGYFQVVLAVEYAHEHAVPDIQKFAEIVAAKLDARPVPPGIERIDVRVAADRIRDQLLAPIGPAFAMLKIPAPVCWSLG